MCVIHLVRFGESPKMTKFLVKKFTKFGDLVTKFDQTPNLAKTTPNLFWWLGQIWRFGHNIWWFVVTLENINENVFLGVNPCFIFRDFVKKTLGVIFVFTLKFLMLFLAYRKKYGKIEEFIGKLGRLRRKGFFATSCTIALIITTFYF